MKDWPTDPIRQHGLLMSAVCADLACGRRGLAGGNAERVAEINRQVNTRDGGVANNAPPTDQ